MDASAADVDRAIAEVRAIIARTPDPDPVLLRRQAELVELAAPAELALRTWLDTAGAMIARDATAEAAHALGRARAIEHDRFFGRGDDARTRDLLERLWGRPDRRPLPERPRTAHVVGAGAPAGLLRRVVSDLLARRTRGEDVLLLLGGEAAAVPAAVPGTPPDALRAAGVEVVEIGAGDPPARAGAALDALRRLDVDRAHLHLGPPDLVLAFAASTVAPCGVIQELHAPGPEVFPADRTVVTNHRCLARLRSPEIARWIPPAPPPGVDPVRADRAEIRRGLGFAEDDFVVGHLGRLADLRPAPWRVAQHAVEIDAGVRFLVARTDGSAADGAAVRLALDGAGLVDHVVYLGDVDDPADLVAALDALVDFPDRDHDPDPTLLALAAGVPVVTTTAAAGAELVRHGVDGLVLPEGALEPVAEALADLARDPLRCDALGRAARDRATALVSARAEALSLLDRDRPEVGGAQLPELSVVVPTRDRARDVAALLACLDAQTLEPSRFELVLVDDGSSIPIEPVARSHPSACHVRVVRTEGAGPAAARNRGIEAARAPLVLFLNDDSRPAPDCLRAHLDTHAALDDAPRAVLGTFGFTEWSRRSLLVRLLEEHSLLFDFRSMRPGGDHGWFHFWTCNLSVPRDLLLEVDGFDETFPIALAEDIELGIRLARRGLVVRHEPRAACGHEHTLTLRGYLARQRALAGLLLRMLRLHGDRELLVHLTGSPERALDADELRVLAEEQRPSIARAEAEVRRAVDEWSFGPADAVPAEAVENLGTLLRAVGYGSFRDGLVEALASEDRPVDAPAPRPEAGTSVVVLSLNGRDDTRACLESLGASDTPPHEIVVVDNGSTDGSVEMLRAWPGIRLVANATNLGAVAARNQAIRVATGDSILFLDNDTVLPPGALRILRRHFERDPSVGLVGPLSNCARGRQEVRPPDYGSIDEMRALAAEIEETAPGAYEDVEKLILFCLLVRREVIDEIGGMDPRFDPWGYEDDDFTLRAWIAGHRLRIARDAYVHHSGSKTSTAASIDYRALLARNWSRFKRKWGLPEDLAPDSALDRAALRDRWRGDAGLRCPIPEGGSPRATDPEIGSGTATVSGKPVNPAIHFGVTT